MRLIALACAALLVAGLIYGANARAPTASRSAALPPEDDCATVEAPPVVPPEQRSYGEPTLAPTPPPLPRPPHTEVIYLTIEAEVP